MDENVPKPPRQVADVTSSIQADNGPKPPRQPSSPTPIRIDSPQPKPPHQTPSSTPPIKRGMNPSKTRE